LVVELVKRRVDSTVAMRAASMVGQMGDLKVEMMETSSVESMGEKKVD
jgi:hypothetical protein